MAHNFLVCVRDGEDDETVLVKHHVIPKAVGGSDHPDNIILCCRNCHWKIHRLPFYRSIKERLEALRDNGGKEVSPAELVVDISSDPTSKEEPMEEVNDLHHGIKALGKDFREFGKEMDERHKRERKRDLKLLRVSGKGSDAWDGRRQVRMPTDLKSLSTDQLWDLLNEKVESVEKSIEENRDADGRLMLEMMGAR